MKRPSDWAAAILAAGLLASSPSRAEPSSKDANAEHARIQGVLDSQHPQFGDVRLAGPNVTLHLGQKFYFLSPEEAKVILKEWGNPPEAADGVLGIVFPSGKTFVDQTWGAVLTFEPSGFVTDKDADKADYDKMIRDEQDTEAADNAQRQKQGFQAMHLVGWAQPPTYDKANHFLVWARDLKVTGEEVDTLNYDLRILGRRGVLSLNLVSKMPDLASTRVDANELAAAVKFDSGSAYGDYQAGTDKKAEYGIAGLVAAGLGLAAAQKLGLLAVVLLFAKKAIVLIVAGFAAVAAWFRRRVGGRKPPATAPGSDEPQATDHPLDPG